MKPVAAKLSSLLAHCLLAAGAAHAAGKAQLPDYLSRADVRSFIEAMRTDHGLDVADLERVLGAAQYQPTVARLLDPEPSSAPSPARSYARYREKFLTPTLIATGTEFWSKHADDLRRAEDRFGVPPEVILGILGVETNYGRNTGSFRAVDALTTAAFDGARRQAFFRDELREVLLLAREKGEDALLIKGSYAGAVGLPQFMPSSYRKYAVDFDGDGHIDLRGSPADAIGSVANYIKSYGWVAGEAPKAPVRLLPGSETTLISGLARVHDVLEVQGKGVIFSNNEPPAGICSIFELPTPGKPSRFFAGFNNFEVITRYNRSTFYASAVLELGTAIVKGQVPAVAAR